MLLIIIWCWNCFRALEERNATLWQRCDFDLRSRIHDGMLNPECICIPPRLQSAVAMTGDNRKPDSNRASGCTTCDLLSPALLPVLSPGRLRNCPQANTAIRCGVIVSCKVDSAGFEPATVPGEYHHVCTVGHCSQCVYQGCRLSCNSFRHESIKKRFHRSLIRA